MSELFSAKEFLAQPRWQQLRDFHGLFVHELPCPHKWEHPFSAYYFSERITEREAIHRIASDFCALEEAGHMATGATEKEAVITLLHRAKLEGWQDVSIRES